MQKAHVHRKISGGHALYVCRLLLGESCVGSSLGRLVKVFTVVAQQGSFYRAS